MSRCLIKSMVLMALILPLSSMAEGVYRSVGKDGEVIFSDTPPADAAKAEKIELPPEPSAGSRRTSEARHSAIQKRLDEMQQARTQRELAKQNRIRRAEKQLAEAEAQFADTKRIRDEDRQSLASGKSRIRPEYFERVKRAEQKVEIAKKNLEQIRRSR